jgi:hypothetical protein
LTNLAGFYNSQNRPESALCHLAKAIQIYKSLDPDLETDDLALSIEPADGNLQRKQTTKQEDGKQVNLSKQHIQRSFACSIKARKRVFSRSFSVA